MALNREKTAAAAQKHIRKQHWDKAIKEYQRLVDDDPNDVRTLQKLADLHVRVEAYADALRVYRAAAHIYAKDDMYEKAVAIYKQAQRIAPDDADLHKEVGDAYHRIGRVKDAVRSYGYAQAIYRKANDTRAQRVVLEKMIELDPDEIGLRVQLAERYEKDGARDQALELFSECAGQLKSDGRMDEYIQVTERILFLKPQDFALRKEMVHLYLDRKDLKYALKHLQLCFKQRSQDLETLDLLGSTFRGLGENDKAVLVLRELANLHVRDGRKDEAKRTFERILEMDPKDRGARAGLKQLEPKQQPTPAPSQPKPAPAKPTPQKPADSLDGIVFLDEDDDEDEEVFGDAPGGFGDDFLAFAQETIGDIQSQADFGKIDELPIAPVEPIEATGVASETKVKQLLAESEVFLKYNLLDRADEVLTRAVRTAPNSISAREQLRKLRERQGDLEAAADELLEMARITRTTPRRASEYLRRARELTAIPNRIETVAAEIGVSLVDAAGPPPPINAIPEITSSNIVTPSDSAPSLAPAEESLEVVYELDPEEMLDDDDLEALGFEAEEIPEGLAEDTGEDAALPESTIPDGMAPAAVTSTHDGPDTATQEVISVDESIDDIDVLDELGDIADFSMEEIDIDDFGADGMFEELFGLDEGTFSEVEVDGEPPSIDQDFGAQSLSRAFSPALSNPSVQGLGDFVNTSLELGTTYQEMGLFSEAIDELKQALEDPQAAPTALYHIALCQLELGQEAEAKSSLSELSNNAAAPDHLRRSASEKLQEIAV